MMIRVLEKSEEIADRICLKLMEEDNDERLEYSVDSDNPNVITCKVDTYGLILTLNCTSPDKSSISCTDILDSSYYDPSDFFNKVSKLDELSSILRHVWYDFNSFLDEEMN